MKFGNSVNSRISIGISFALFLGAITYLQVEGVGGLQQEKPSLKKIQEPVTAVELIDQLGCNTCHDGLGRPGQLKRITPDLRHAGSRYLPAYLLSYLQNPQQIRNHIGRSRMPDFHFEPEEALALVSYLTDQTGINQKWPEFPVIPDQKGDPARGKALFNELACNSCHSIGNKGTALVSDLSHATWRLNPAWLKKYLVAPSAYGEQGNQMPAFFYSLSEDSSQFVEAVPGAAAKINDLVAYLTSMNSMKKEQLEKEYENTVAAAPEVTSGMGQLIFRSQNCAACHLAPDDGLWREHTAPDLSSELDRVRREWLSGFLNKPEAIRPFGFHPGSGSRMPDFGLTDNETAMIVEHLEKLSTEQDQQQPPMLSVFSMNKAETLLREKLSCLGCHRLGDEGGRVGPDLSNLPERLQPEYVRKVITDPHALIPGTVMPKVPMPPQHQKLITHYLLQQDEYRNETDYLSLVNTRISLTKEEDGNIKFTYMKYCGMCHGNAGRVDGYNVAFLKDVPTNHADAGHMATRPDDTLFDGIYAGGYILNKSPLMPPWGETLSIEEMQDLVRYMRELCNCEGPGWSRDNAGD